MRRHGVNMYCLAKGRGTGNDARPSALHLAIRSTLSDAVTHQQSYEEKTMCKPGALPAWVTFGAVVCLALGACTSGNRSAASHDDKHNGSDDDARRAPGMAGLSARRVAAQRPTVIIRVRVR
jgi:hypothetical protein